MPEPVAIGQFHGLSLASDTSDVPPSFASDLSNVELDRRGLMLRTRDGTSKFTSSTVASGTDLESLGFYVTQRHVLVGNNTDNKTYVLDSTGAAVASSAAKSFVPSAYVNYGTPTSGIMYIANGTDTVYTWNGLAFAVPVYTGTTPKGSLLAVTPWDNRLVNGGGVATIPQRLLFSDAGTATTFGANNFIDLEPGDSESLQALVVWRDLMFAFKQSKFFVFYATDTDSSGNPVFRYRAIRTGLGVGSPNSVIAGRDGVYFVNDQGVWLTNGGPPVKVSAQLDELFYGGLSESWTGPDGIGAFHDARMAYHNGKVFLAVFFFAGVNVAAQTWTFVYENGEWALWDLNAANWGTASPRSLLSVQLSFGASHTLLFVSRFIDRIFKLDPSVTTDDGAAIPWKYTSAKYRLAAPGHVAITRETSLFGTGTVTLALASDLYADQSASVALGTAPTPAEGWLQKDQEGCYFQHKLSGTAAATVRAITHYVSSVKPPGIQ